VELIDALEQTFDHAHRVIANVRADQLGAPTPCAEWDVRQLLEHAVGDAPAPFVLGPDPASQFREAADGALAGWRTPGVFDRIVDGGAGPMPGRVLAGINLLDTATHSWDLATATGQPAALPDAVAETALEACRATISPEIRPGRFGPEVTAPANAGPTERLVAFLGRQP
jgi:uncharacterized protein (TIGR03086 family)